MKKFWLLVGVGLVLSLPARAQLFGISTSFESACAEEMREFCAHAISYHMADCLMRHERYVSVECSQALDDYNYTHQQWYPEARYRWIRGYDENRRMR